MTKLAIAIAISEVIAVWLAWRILRSSDPLFFRIANSLVAFIPFLGPIAAYWAANFPDPHHPAFRDNERYSADVFSRWIGVLSMKDPERRKKKWKQVMDEHDRENPD
jgi:hypothetical protein